MIFQVPVAFAVRVVPKGRRDEAVRVGRDRVAVEVSEVSGLAAPVALRCPGDRDLRFHEGRFWAPAHVPDGGGFGGVIEGMPGAGDPLGRRVPGGEAVKPDEEGRVRFSGRDAEVARVQSCANRYLIIDGVPHASEPQPVYRIGERSGQHFVEIAALGAVGDPLATFAPGEEWAIQRAYGLSVPDDLRIEAEMPEVLQGNLPEKVLMRAASFAMSRLGALIAERDEATFHAYRTLRDALPPRNVRPEAPVVATLLRAALGNEVGLGDHVSGVVSLALDRFDASDVGMASSLAPS